MEPETLAQLAGAAVSLVGVPAAYFQARAARLAAETAADAEHLKTRQESLREVWRELLSSAREIDGYASKLLMCVGMLRPTGHPAPRDGTGVERMMQESAACLNSSYNSLSKAIAAVQLEGPEELLPKAERMHELASDMRFSAVDVSRGFRVEGSSEIADREFVAMVDAATEFDRLRVECADNIRSYLNRSPLEG